MDQWLEFKSIIVFYIGNISNGLDRHLGSTILKNEQQTLEKKFKWNMLLLFWAYQIVLGFSSYSQVLNESKVEIHTRSHFQYY